MNHRNLVLLTALAAFLVVALAGPAPAQDEPKSPPTDEKKEGEEKKVAEMDDLSRKTLDAYKKLLHHPGAAGVKKASVTIKATLENPMMGGTQEAKGSYKWDGKKGTLTWDKEQVGATMGGAGIDKELFDSDFDLEFWKKEFAGGKFTAEQKDDGTILVKVTGETESGLKSFLFGKDGLAKQLVVSTDVGMGAKRDMTVDLQYRKEGDKYLQTGETNEMEVPSMGKMSVKRETTFEKVEGIWLRKKIVSKTTMGERAMGGVTVELTDWKLNDAVK